MIVRQATIEEMLALWFKFYTTDFFIDNIERGNAEFWAIEHHSRLIGELYIFKNLDDPDAGGLGHFAYLYGFQIEEIMITFIATVAILILVFIIQFVGDFFTKHTDKR